MDRKPDLDAYAELSHLYRTAPVGLCLMDTDLRFVRINERLASINGRPAEEHIGKTLHEIIPEIADQVEAAYRRVLESGEPMIDIEIHGETPAHPGEERSWIVSHHPLKSSDGSIVGVTTVVRDVTEQVQAEREVERLAAIGTFAAGIAHRINNALGGILLAAQSAQISIDDPERVAGALADIVSDVKRCGRVAKSLLTLAREEAVRPHPGNLEDAVRAAARGLRGQAAEAGVAIDLELAGSLPEVEFSATALTEVIAIVITNAIEAGASRVVVSTEADDACVRLHVTVTIALPRIPDASP